MTASLVPAGAPVLLFDSIRNNPLRLRRSTPVRPPEVAAQAHASRFDGDETGEFGPGWIRHPS